MTDLRIVSVNMTGPELYALRAAGYEPIGVVVGASAMSMGGKAFGRSIRAIFNAGEMSAISQTSAIARRNALSQAEEEAKKIGADMIIVNMWDIRDVAEIVEVTCTATAVRRVAGFTLMPIATATN